MTPAQGIIQPVDFKNPPDWEPVAQTVAMMDATLDLDAGRYDARGRAWWLMAADWMVCWVVTITAHIGVGSRTYYGAAGPAPTFLAAIDLAQVALHNQLAAILAELRHAGGAPDSQAEAQADRIARLQALAAANPGVKPWSSDR